MQRHIDTRFARRRARCARKGHRPRKLRQDQAQIGQLRGEGQLARCAVGLCRNAGLNLVIPQISRQKQHPFWLQRQRCRQLGPASQDRIDLRLPNCQIGSHRIQHQNAFTRSALQAGCALQGAAIARPQG